MRNLVSIVGLFAHWPHSGLWLRPASQEWRAACTSQCPNGYVCTNNFCWLKGTGPDGGVPSGGTTGRGDAAGSGGAVASGASLAGGGTAGSGGAVGSGGAASSGVRSQMVAWLEVVVPPAVALRKANGGAAGSGGAHWKWWHGRK